MNIFDRLAALVRKLKRNKTPEAPLEVTAERISRSQFTSMPPRPEFQAKLLEQLQRARRNQPTLMVDRTSRFITGLIRSLTAVPILASVLVVAIFVSTIAPLGTGLRQVSELLIPAAHASDNFSIDPTAGDRLGVASSTSFVVTSKTPLKREVLQQALHLVPALEYSLTEKSPTEFVVTPRTALAPRTLYRIIIDSSVADEAGITVKKPFSFAFEVKEKVRVISSIPGDKTTGVPVKTAIEFYLSHDGLENAAEAITVAPAFKYVVETKGRKLIVKPQELLKMGTIYTIKLSKNLRVASSTETLGTEYVVSFETERATDVERDWFLNERVVEFSPEQKAFIPVYGLDAKTIAAEFNATVYRFASPEAYAKELTKYEQVPYWSWYQRNSYAVATSSLTRAFQTPLVVDQDEYGGTSLRFPNKLTVGWYVADITAAKKTRQVLFQVTPWGVFSTKAAGKIVLWVNNLLTQTPAISANVTTVSGTIVGTTNGQGVVQLAERDMFTSTSTFQTAYVVVGSGVNAVVVAVDQSSGGVLYDDMRPVGGSYSDYWQYVTTDRQVYKTGDTAQVWGFVAPREKGVAKPADVRLKLLGSGTDWYGNQQVITDKKVSLTAGSFSTSLSLATLGTGYYTLKAFVGETIVSSQYIRVEKYEKPVLTLALTPSTYAVHTNEKFTATVRGTFFDGTPAARVPINYQFDNQSGVVMLDDAGRATISLTAPYDTCRAPVEPNNAATECYFPQTETITIRPQSGEYGDVSTSDSVTIFGANVYFNDSRSGILATPNSVEVSTTLYVVDSSRVGKRETTTNNSSDQQQNSLPRYLTTPVPGALVDGILMQTVYVKVSQGTIYNNYTKQMEEQFTTVASTTVAERFSERTNSNGQLIKRFSTRPDVNYTLYLRTLDSKGFPEYGRVYFYGQSEVQNKRINNPSYQPYGGISLKLAEKNKEYVAGEEARVVLTTDEDKPISTPGKNLFLRSNGRYLEAEVRPDTSYAFGFAESDIPTTYVMAARLSGNDYQTMSYGLPVTFNQKIRALTVSVTSTKPTYLPGEQAMVVVNVRDAEGNPVIGAVNLNVVDEAYYAFNPESAHPLEALYSAAGNPFSFLHRSHEFLKAQNLGLDEGRGGGGDGDDRTNFADTAATLSGITNADGEVVFTVKLPDNITSWRATAQVITEKIFAGASTTPIVVTKPVFVQPSIAPSYVAGDKPVLAVQAYGTGLQQNDKLQLGFSAPSLGVTESIEPGVPFIPRYVSLPQLTAGVYETRMSVTSPRGNDAVRLPLTVVPSRQREQVEKKYDVTPGTTITGSAFGPTTITVMDKERGSFYGDLLAVSYESSNRFDDRLAAAVAERALQTYFGDQASRVTSSFERYQTVNRGMALVPYGGSDPYVTMLTSVAHTDGVDTAGLVRYWYDLLNNESTPREQAIMALVGLSALSEPVLLPVRSMAAVKDLTLIERSYLALAASVIGDETLARSLYHDLADTSSVLSADQERSLKGIADEELVRQTAGALAMVSARLNDPASEEWARTLSTNGLQNPSSHYSLETALYISNRLPYLKGGEQSFTWTYRGETTTRTIARGDRGIFDLPTGTTEQVVFGTSTGKIVAIARSEQPVTKTSGTPGYNVQREFWVNGVPTTTFALGDMVEVRLFPGLSFDSKNSAYDLTDMLPSGLSYVGQTYSWLTDRAPSCAQSYPYAVDGQEVKFFVYSDWSKVRPQGCLSVPYLSYKARVRGPGTYVAEPTVLQSFSNPSVRGYGNNDSIIISTTTRVMSTSSAI